MSKRQQPLTICYVAGKSGGHIIPCITLAYTWKNTHQQGHVLFISSKNPLDMTLTTNLIIDKAYHLSLENPPQKKIHQYPLFIWQLINSMIRSIIILKRHRPTSIVSTGGVVAIPVVLAARILRIPVTLWELNAIPGRTTKLLARFAHTINACFSQVKSLLKNHSCSIAPYPTRYTKQQRISRTEAHDLLRLDHTRLTLFILGGSQGSASLNTILKKLILEHPTLANHIACIHQTGNTDATDWQQWYRAQRIPAFVFAYRDDLAPCYSAADIIISRAGAGAIFELLIFEKPSLLIPLQTSYNSHQIDNARAAARQFPTIFSYTTEPNESQKLYNLISNRHKIT